MDNNERFNQMLNSCQHPRAVYKALSNLVEFIAYQEQITGRPLSYGEKKATAVWFPIIIQSEPGDTEIVDKLIARHPDKSGINHFLETIKNWMEISHERRNH